MDNVAKVVALIVGMIGIVIFLGLLLSLPVMWLWNGCLVPAIPGINEIGWLQAWGILVLCGFLFKNSSVKSSN